MSTITVNTHYTLGAADTVVLVDSSGGSITITLPTSPPSGRRYFIKDKFGTTDTNPIVVSATPSQIDNQGSFTLTTEKQAILAHFDGSSWYIL